MDGSARAAFADYQADLAPAAARIRELQRADGSIPWFEDGPWDPWNHVECAMALTAIGDEASARAAYDFLARTQRPDGAWLGDYGNALPMVSRDHISRETAPRFLDTNFCAYPAVGAAHFLLATDDQAAAQALWPMVRAAIDFVVALQRDDGAFPWAFESIGAEQDDALLAGNASIAKSLECAIFLARQLAEPAENWIAARHALVCALRSTPEVFDRRGVGDRFAMDWYYPVLSGALDPAAALRRLEMRWDDFVDADHGCRCVSDEPWFTIAETSELAIALVAAGDRMTAEALLKQVMAQRDAGGVFWMGWQSEESIVWPREQPSWTQAAVILAADALRGDNRASALLTRTLL